MIHGRIRFYTDALFLLLFLVVIPVILQKEKTSGGGTDNWQVIF